MKRALLRLAALLAALRCVQAWAWAPTEPSTTVTSRRDVLHASTAIAAAAAVATTTIHPVACHAASPLDAAEAVRRSAANIPGYGQTDVFYPISLAGSWKATRVVELPGRDTPLRLTYTYRFIPSIEDDAVVADRGANQAELEQAIIQTVLIQDDSTTIAPTTPKVQHEWTASNPNNLRLVLSDGTKKEIKVTKRATERTQNTVSSSEFQRVTQEDQRGIPNVSARRVVSKWKMTDDGTAVEGLEVVYAMGGADPLAANGGISSQPTALSKSRIYLVR